MKKTILILTALLGLFGCAAQEGWRGSLKDGIGEAQELGQPVLLLITNEDCGACEINWLKIFGREEFLAGLNGKCVPVCLLCPFDDCRGECATARNFEGGTKSPSLFLLDSQGKHVKTFRFPYGSLEECRKNVLEAIDEKAK